MKALKVKTIGRFGIQDSYEVEIEKDVNTLKELVHHDLLDTISTLHYNQELIDAKIAIKKAISTGEDVDTSLVKVNYISNREIQVKQDMLEMRYTQIT